MAATVLSFGEWLPDQPALGNPGLIKAENVVPQDGSYEPFFPLTPIGSGYTLPGLPRGGFIAQDTPLGTFPEWAYAATGSDIYEAAIGSAATGTFNARTSGLSTMAPYYDASFAQFDNLVFAARGIDGVLFHTVGSASNFATVSGLTGSRDGRYAAVVGRFLVIGNLGSATTRPSTLEWSAINDPTNFPTPNSATAIATQSGEQVLNVADGDIVGIFGHDQHAVILQRGAITRMTYVGPPVVFQFDRIEVNRGCNRFYGSAAEGPVAHLLSADGFYKTDGVNLAPTGVGKVDKSFLLRDRGDVALGSVTAYAHTEAAFDPNLNCVFWSYPETLTTFYSTKLFMMSCDDGRWSSATQTLRSLIEPAASGKVTGLLAFNSSHVLCKFRDVAGTALIETGEMELNPGGRSYVDAIKPHVEYNAGTVSSPFGISVRIGTRPDLGTVPSYSATAFPLLNTRTSFAHFRSDAKYHRFEVAVTGSFDKASGLEFRALPSGET